MDQKQQLGTWLGDAYAMEMNGLAMLRRQVAAAAGEPHLRQRLEEHLEATKRHADLVDECLGRLGARPSVVKSVAGGLMGIGEGLVTGMFSDQVLKNLLAAYAIEHLEIACYSALIAAAEEAGIPAIAESCSWILREEAAMADWLEDELPAAARRQLRAGPGDPAITAAIPDA